MPVSLNPPPATLIGALIGFIGGLIYGAITGQWLADLIGGTSSEPSSELLLTPSASRSEGRDPEWRR